MERLHILDGYGYIFRAHFGLAMSGRDRRGVRLTTAGGMPTGALYVYASMLIRLYLDVKPQRILVVFDAPGRTFRDDLDPEYKANRSEMPDDLKVQMPYFRPITEAFSWPVISVSGVEADDVIASATREARERDWDVVIFAADKDLMNLVDDRVVMIDSMRQITYDAARVEEKFGVPPALVSEWLSLVGDTSDNIPGMKGVGKKTATTLLNEHGSIDGILANTSALKGKMKERFEDPTHLAQLELSRKLVALKFDVEIPADIDSFVQKPWDSERIEKLFTELEFQVLLERLEGKKAGAPATARKVAVARGSYQSGPTPIAITDLAQLAPIIKAAREKKRLAFGVETDGARPDRAQLVGLTVAAEGVAAGYLPLQHRYLGVPAQLSTDDLGDLRKLLADPSIEIICHDVKTVYRMLEPLGWQLESLVCDTMLASYLIDASSDAFLVHQVAAVAIGADLKPRTDLIGKGKNKIDFTTLTVEEAAAWSGLAIETTLASAGTLIDQLAAARLGSLFSDVEAPLAALLARMEALGVCINVAYLRTLADELGQNIAELERTAHELAGETFNLGSPKQLSHLLFDKLALRSELMKKTKTGFSTDHEVLESLREDHPIIGPILEHRELVKLKGTYIDALPPLVNPITGRLHTTFRQAVAATGRLTSHDPNLQNIPIRTELGRRIRRAFVAAPGKTLVSADYSQIELRILAHLSGDPVLIEAFKQGVDIHTQTAAEVFDIPREQVGATERRVAKAVNYGLVYGQSEFGLARTLGIARAEAKHYIDRYFERFSTVRTFMDKIVTDAVHEGASLTVLGRRRPIPGLSSRNYRIRSAAERIAQNTPMQGSGADIIKLAMLRVDSAIRDSRLEADMVLTVHDELVFEIERDKADDLATLVVREMEAAYELSIPLVVDVQIAENWADAH